jgi:hypothetical protein
LVFIAECHHVQSLTGGDSEHFRAMSLLVSLFGTEADRAALWPLRHALAFARCAVVGGAEWPDRLAEHVAALRPTFATATVFVGSSTNIVAETVQSAIDTLYRQFSSALVVVVVSGTAESLLSLDGVHGFVHGVRSTAGDTAGQVFLALASLHACETLNGIRCTLSGTSITPLVCSTTNKGKGWTASSCSSRVPKSIAKAAGIAAMSAIADATRFSRRRLLVG